MNDLNIVKELIVKSYSKTFDKDLAYSKLNLSEKEIEFFEEDNELQARLNILLIEKREELMERLFGFVSSIDDKISYRATMDLIGILYKDLLETKKRDSPPVVFNINTPINSEEKIRVKSEYGLLLNTAVVFEDEDDTKKEANNFQ